MTTSIVPDRTIVASYPTYLEAQAAVDKLSDEKFPVENVRIVGSGMRTVEYVTGRRGYLQAALGGLGSGALFGFFLGWLFGAISFFEPLQSAIALGLWGALIGGAIGLVFGAIAHALTFGKRDFDSLSRLEADRYDIEVVSDFADDARALLNV